MEQTSTATPGEGPNAAELYARIVEGAPGFAIYTIDRAGMTTSWTGAAERVFGWTAEDMVGRSGDQVFTPEDRSAGVPDAARAAAGAAGRAEAERWHQRKDGSRFWGSGLLMPLSDPARGYLAILHDLSDRHRAEQRHRHSECLFQVLAADIPQLVFQARPDGGRSWFSPQWTAFTGVAHEASLGSLWLETVHPDDRAATAAAWAAAQAAGSYLVEHRIRAATGEYRWHQTRARPIDPEGEGGSLAWLGTSADINHLRGMQERQAVLVAELQHRSRNLLGIVQSMARRILQRKPSAEEFEAEFAERLATLGRVQNLLALTTAYAVDLQALIEAEVTAYADGDAETDKVIIEGPKVVLRGEVAQTLALVLHELATNAIKHGALSQEAGRIRVTWHPDPEGAERVAMEWRESAVVMPPGPYRKGYGSELIERAIPYQLRTETRLAFGPDGVHCRVVVPTAPAAALLAEG